MARRTALIDETTRREQRLAWFMSEAHRQAANRDMRARCERYYDSEQIDPEVRAEIEARGQHVVVFNEIKPTIDWLIGTERRTRVDFRVIPRDSIDKEATADAENKTKLLKWLSDVNRAPFERSAAFDDAQKSGLGWLEMGVRGDTTDIPIYKRSEPWRNMLHDSIGTQGMDIQSGRYVFRVKVVDLDLAIAYFPGAKEKLYKVRQDGNDLQAFKSWMMGAGSTLDLGLLSGGDSNDNDADYATPIDVFNPRERVLLIECWSTEPDMTRQRASPSSFDRQAMRIRCSIMTEFDTIIEEWSPYKHNRYPFVPVWAYRNKRTGLPYPPIKPLMDKQDALNKAMSKALWEASVNQVFIEVGAVDKNAMPIEKIHTEVQDPNGVVILANGALTGKRFQTRRGLENAQSQLLLADMYRNSMRDEGSVTPSNRGLDSSATSGKAIGLQQDQGSVLSTELFDNALLARQLEGEMELSLSEQYMNEPRVIALPGERGQSQLLAINQPQADGTYLNDITARSAQFVVGEQAWRQTLAQAAFESMMELMGKLAPVAPQVVVATLDLVFEYADLPNKESFLQRVRQATGQPGPDNQQSPEQQAAAAKKAAIDEMTFKLQLAKLQADVSEAQKKGEKLDAEAMMKRLEGLYMAAQAAQVIGMAPQITPIADELLSSAGYQDRNTGSVIPPQPAAAAPVVPEAQQTDGGLAGSMAGSLTPAADGVAIQ